jgi:hypothetical protein
VDGHRRYADEPEQSSWYPGKSTPTGQNQYAHSASPYDSGVYERPSGAFRLPDQRPGDDYTPDPVTSTGSHARATSEHARVPVRGPEYPAVRPNSGASLADAPATHAYTGGSAAPSSGLPAPSAGYNEPTSLVPPLPAPDRGREAVYGTRRPVSAVVVAFVTVLLMVPVIRLLVQATFADDAVASSIVPAVLLMLGLPLTGVGLYALAGGGRPQNRDTWLRPPVAYLPTGLFLVLAAALAVA